MVFVECFLYLLLTSACRSSAYVPVGGFAQFRRYPASPRPPLLLPLTYRWANFLGFVGIRLHLARLACLPLTYLRASFLSFVGIQLVLARLSYLLAGRFSRFRRYPTCPRPTCLPLSYLPTDNFAYFRG